MPGARNIFTISWRGFGLSMIVLGFGGLLLEWPANYSSTVSSSCMTTNAPSHTLSTQWSGFKIIIINFDGIFDPPGMRGPSCLLALRPCLAICLKAVRRSCSHLWRQHRRSCLSGCVAAVGVSSIMGFSKAALLRIPGIRGLIVASRIKLGTATYGEFAAESVNWEAVGAGSKSKSKQLAPWLECCRAVIAMKALEAALENVKDLEFGEPVVTPMRGDYSLDLTEQNFTPTPYEGSRPICAHPCCTVTFSSNPDCANIVPTPLLCQVCTNMVCYRHSISRPGFIMCYGCHFKAYHEQGPKMKRRCSRQPRRRRSFYNCDNHLTYNPTSTTTTTWPNNITAMSRPPLPDSPGSSMGTSKGFSMGKLSAEVALLQHGDT